VRPGRADRDLAEPERPAALLDHLLRLAVDFDRPRQVRGERVGVRDVVRVDRRQEADDHDQQEENDRADRDPVAHEPAPGETPGALARNLLGGLAGGESDLRFRLVGEFSHSPLSTPYLIEAYLIIMNLRLVEA
jgi:hypothetical protein